MRSNEKEIEHYRILDRLGEGRIGVVFKVLDAESGEIRVLKKIRPGLARKPAYRTHLGRVAKDLARLDHPHVAAVYRCCEHPAGPFLVSEYVDGLSFGDLLRRDEPLDPARALPLLKQILAGLDHAHREGVVHRDLKPSDILVTREGRVKIVDFGLVRDEDGADLADAAVPLDVLHYLSPEHVKSRAGVDHRSDLYAVGVVCYETLTGRPPFEADETAYRVMRAVMEDAVTPPSQVVADLPEDLSQIVMRALARDPADRFQTAAEMLEALQAFEARASSPAADRSSAGTDAGPVRRAGGRRRFLYGSVLLACLVTVVLAWWALRGVPAPPAQPSAAAAQVDSVAVTLGIYERILPAADGGQRMLVLRALPRGEIRLGGRVVGTDSARVAVGAARQRVTFVHPRYGEREAAVQVGPQQQKEVTCYFEGYLRVHAADDRGLPLRADLFVDDLETGRRTPLLRPYALRPGTHTVRVALEGYLSGTTRVAVRPASGAERLAAPPIEPLEFVLRKAR